MHVKEIIIEVLDTSGKPVKGADVRLAGVPTEPIRDRKRLVWRDVDIDASEVVADPDTFLLDGYRVESWPEPYRVAADDEVVPLKLIVIPIEEPDTVKPYIVTEPVDELIEKPPEPYTQQYVPVEPPVEETRWKPKSEQKQFASTYPSGAPLYYVEEEGPRPSEELVKLWYQWENDQKRNCDLCQAFEDLRDAINPDAAGNWCNAAASVFLENIRGQLALLSDACRNPVTFDQIGIITDDESLFAAVDYQEAQLADIMTAYKGLYDLILLEGESGQIPSTYIDDIREKLEQPFSCYQCLQTINTKYQALLHKDALGAGQAQIAAESDALVQAIGDLLDTLDGFAAAGMPAAARSLAGSLHDLQQDIEANDRLIAYLGKARGNDMAAQLEKALSAAETQRETALGRIIALRESVRLQEFPQGWRERAGWLAEAKAGLKAVWEALTALISSLRNCLELIRQGRGQSWFVFGGGGGGQMALAKGGVPPAGMGVPGGRYGGVNPIVALSRDVSDMRDAMRDMATFSPTKNDGGGGGGFGDGGGYARRVAQVYTAVTGQPMARDPRSFRSTLRATFPSNPATGQIAREPVRSVVSLYADSGAAGELAAAQGTLRQIVGLVVADAHKVLNGLRSIGTDTDEERAQALTYAVQHSFDTLADEAGRVDRPRRTLTDDTFTALLPPNGFLGELRQELELNSTGDSLLNPDLVTTAEAQLIAGMDLLDEYAQTLFDAYTRYYQTPTGQDPRNGSFSGRAAYIALLFSVVAHSVRELLEAMTAVDFSAPERRTTFITDPVSGATISIDGILSWTENTMVNTGPRLLADSGLIGLNRVENTIANRIAPLIVELLAISRGVSRNNPPPAPHPALTHSRVRNALVQLANQINQF